MSVLEEKIQKNKEYYDVHEPGEGHFDRFVARLDASLHSDKSRSGLPLWRYAATIVLIASLAAILLYQYGKQASQVNANPVNEELSQVMDHYNRLTDKRLNDISQCASSDTEAAKINEMARLQLNELEKDAVQLQQELDNDASNERVYGALVTNYRTRIKILDNIINKICQL